MSRLFKVSLIGLAAVVAGLSGCGGGKSVVSLDNKTTGQTPTPTTTNSRIISGKVVSTASGNPGLANVMVTIGESHSAWTDSNGKFSITFNLTDSIAPTFSVDISGAGTGYRKDDLITYNDGQQYLWDAIDLPVEVRNVAATADLGTIYARYAPDDPPSIAYPNKDTVITGRVVKTSSTSTGIAGVKVYFGVVKQFSATTGANGYFSINVGRNVVVLSLFSSVDKTFSIDTSAAGTTYPNTRGVTYGGQSYYQSSISVPSDVLDDNSNDLGTIYYQDITPSTGGDSDPNNPPGAPF